MLNGQSLLSNVLTSALTQTQVGHRFTIIRTGALILVITWSHCRFWFWWNLRRTWIWSRRSARWAYEI